MTETSGPQTTPPNKKRCPRCGASNPATADWCTLCLERFSEPIPVTEPVPPPLVPQDPEPPAPPDQQPTRWTVGKVLTTVVAIIAIASGLLVAGFFLLMTVAMANFGSGK